MIVLPALRSGGLKSFDSAPVSSLKRELPSSGLGRWLSWFSLPSLELFAAACGGDLRVGDVAVVEGEETDVALAADFVWCGDGLTVWEDERGREVGDGWPVGCGRNWPAWITVPSLGLFAAAGGDLWEGDTAVMEGEDRRGEDTNVALAGFVWCGVGLTVSGEEWGRKVEGGRPDGCCGDWPAWFTGGMENCCWRVTEGWPVIMGDELAVEGSLPGTEVA